MDNGQIANSDTDETAVYPKKQIDRAACFLGYILRFIYLAFGGYSRLLD